MLLVEDVESVKIKKDVQIMEFEMEFETMGRNSLIEEYFGKQIYDVSQFDVFDYDLMFNVYESNDFLPPFLQGDNYSEEKEEEFYDLLGMETDEWEDLLKNAEFDIDTDEEFVSGEQYHLDESNVIDMIFEARKLEEHAKEVMEYESKCNNSELLTLDELSDYTGKTRKELVEIAECPKEDNLDGIYITYIGNKYGYWDYDNYSSATRETYDKFRFFKDEFEEGEPTAAKLDEDERREKYIEDAVQKFDDEGRTMSEFGNRYYMDYLVEVEEAELEINY